MNLPFVIFAVILVAIVAVASSAIRIMREYQRAVVFTFGRFTGVKGPGLFLLACTRSRWCASICARWCWMCPVGKDVISRDNVSVKVNAVLYFRVVDADKAVIQIENFLQATSQLAQTTLRWCWASTRWMRCGPAERDKLNADIQEILDMHTEAWGVKVTNVEIKQVDLDHSMVRAIARQAEASASAGPRSSTPKASSRRHRNWWKPPRSWRLVPGQCSCATSAR